MILLRAVASVLSWLGRQGTRAVAAVIFIAIAVPWMGEILRPFLTFSIFALLTIAFMRVDLNQVRQRLRQPRLVLLASGWSMLVVPGVFGAVMLIAGVDASTPDLFLAIMLQSMASPLISAPAFAALVGLDATLILVTLVVTTISVPFTAALFALIYFGPEMSLAPLVLGGQLAALLGGAAVAATIIRRVAGYARIVGRSAEIDGVNIILLYVFSAAIMENVTSGFLATPWLMIGLTALSFVIFFVMFTTTAVSFWWAGRDSALSLGFMVSQRNMGLMLGATGGVLPDLTWIYFALAQFPIYLTPQMLKPVIRKLRGPSGAPSPPR
ncbi:MAG: Na+-dependent transporter [Alphaproteobacteria bacterium]